MALDYPVTGVAVLRFESERDLEVALIRHPSYVVNIVHKGLRISHIYQGHGRIFVEGLLSSLSLLVKVDISEIIVAIEY